MLKVGVTGGIGAGKSMICAQFEKLGVRVYYADVRAKALVLNDKKLSTLIKKAFGEKILDKDKNIDRQKLASVVFADSEALEKLNQLVHPAVINDFNLWCEHRQHEKYVIKEAALIFESDTYKDLDVVITVYAPLEIRLQRVMDRDGTSRENVMQRVKNQLSDEVKIERSDFVIHSYGDHDVSDQVYKLHKHFSEL